MRSSQQRVNDALKLLVKKRTQIENMGAYSEPVQLEIRYLWAEAEDALLLLQREQKSYDIRITEPVHADN